MKLSSHSKNNQIAVSGKVLDPFKQKDKNSTYFLPRAIEEDTIIGELKGNVFFGKEVIKLKEYKELEQLITLDTYNSQVSNQSSEVKGLNSMVVPITESANAGKKLYVHESTELVYTPTNTLVRALSVSPKEDAKPGQRRLYVESGSRLGMLGLWSIPESDELLLQLASNQGLYETTNNEEIVSISIPYPDVIPASYSGSLTQIENNPQFKLLSEVQDE